MAIEIRDAQPADLESIVAIYNHYIGNDHATFDTKPFSAEQKRPWFESMAPGQAHQCLVAAGDTELLGYCYSGPLRPKPAYDSSVETTIYLAPGAVGRGVGRPLYRALLINLSKLPSLHRAFAVIAQPNPASNRLHESLGYQLAGTLPEVGFKFGRFWDTAYYQRALPAEDIS